MRDGDVHIGVFRWIIYPRMERAVWLEELRLEFNLALNVDGTDRRPESHNLTHELLLGGRRKIHSGLRTEPRIEKINIMLGRNFLERLVGKFFSFFGRILFIGIEVPPRATKQRQHNDEENHNLPRRFPFRI